MADGKTDVFVSISDVVLYEQPYHINIIYVWALPTFVWACFCFIYEVVPHY